MSSPEYAQNEADVYGCTNVAKRTTAWAQDDSRDGGGRGMLGTIPEVEQRTTARMQDDSRDGGGRAMSGTIAELERLRRQSRGAVAEDVQERRNP